MHGDLIFTALQKKELKRYRSVDDFACSGHGHAAQK